MPQIDTTRQRGNEATMPRGRKRRVDGEMYQKEIEQERDRERKAAKEGERERRRKEKERKERTRQRKEGTKDCAETGKSESAIW